ncbi:MAG: hypothetical protein ACN4GF_12285 [Lentimonas sp.]
MLGASNATARNDDALYALGGFIGGVITTKALDHREVVYANRSCSPHYYEHGHSKHRCDHGCKHYAKHAASTKRSASVNGYLFAGRFSIITAATVCGSGLQATTPM